LACCCNSLSCVYTRWYTRSPDRSVKDAAESCTSQRLLAHALTLCRSNTHDSQSFYFRKTPLQTSQARSVQKLIRPSSITVVMVLWPESVRISSDQVFSLRHDLTPQLNPEKLK
jgi:hypothetical protein